MGRRKKKDAARTAGHNTPAERSTFRERPRRPVWPPVWPYAVLAALAFFVYGGALFNGFASDDTSQLLQNPAVRDFHQIPQILFHDVWAFMREPGGQASNYYRPLQFVIYMAVYYAVGYDASWF